jgi:hypothetical protein
VLVRRPVEEAEQASGLRSGPNAEEGSSRPSGQKLRREKISIFFSFSNISKPFSNSF